MIHELLHDLLMEQNKVNGEWKDDIDLRVDELKANEGRRVCPVAKQQWNGQGGSVSILIVGSALKLLKSKFRGATFWVLH